MINRIHSLIDLPLILVSGQARSGTTVLTKAIGRHRSVFSNLKESNYLADVVAAVQKTLTMKTRRGQLLVPEKEFAEKFRETLWQVLFPIELWDEAEPPLAVSTYSALNAEVADFLPQFFPKLQIVNIVRNGLEVVASRMAHKHIGACSFEEHCLAWASCIDVISWGEPHDFFHLIRQEDFLNEERTQRVFEELYPSMGLPTCRRSVVFVGRRKINTTRLESESEDAELNLENRRERWKSWYPEQRKTFERICGPVMEQLNFEIPWAQ